MKLEDTKRSLVVAQDIKLVKALAGNNPKLRDRALKNLRKWFDHRSSKIPFTENEFIRIWKGLFYAMWMSDKPLVQEECAEKIAQLLHFENVDTSLLFFKCSFIVLSTEWFGIDQLRLDKFLMFVRRILRQALFVLKNNNWQLASVTSFGDILFETVLQNDNNNHLGLTMHIIEIYLEELAKVSKGETDPSLMVTLLKPFIQRLATLNDTHLLAHMKKYLFHHLLHQSDAGIEYQVKFQAWKGEGFPGGTIDAMENVRDVDDDEAYSDEELDNQVLDPRAGEVDVVLPQLKFNARQISKLLLKHKFVDGSSTKSRKAITDLAKKFQRLSKGNFPLGIKKIQIPDDDGYSTNIRKSVNRLVKFEKQLLGNNRKRKLKEKKTDSTSSPPKKSKMDEEFEYQQTADELPKDKIRNGSNRKKDNSVETSSKKSKDRERKHPKVNGSDLFQKKLENFIRKSEGGKTPILKKRKLIKKNSQVSLIQRNSGTWFVEQVDSNEIANNSINHNHNNYVDELNVTPTTVFPQNEWDAAPKEGEVEIFVPANKYKKKLEKIAKKSGKEPSLLLKESLDRLVKPRYSLDSNLVKNPYSLKRLVTPRSEKKVKINLKLNSSQEIYEHRAQLRRSPAIPFDANRMPNKPLLKFNLNSPINPFCK